MKVGDVVKLKSGGPKMTVEKVYDYAGENYKNVDVVWMDSGGDEKRGNFESYLLEVCDAIAGGGRY